MSFGLRWSRVLVPRGPSPASAVCARSAARTRAARSDWSTRAIPLPRWRSAMGPWRRVPRGQA